MDTPRFAEEMADIERQRTSIRDEIGDEAYDRYLAALDHPNRVAVDEVLLESPAAAAGLQAGDVVRRYADARIFAPNELVDCHPGRGCRGDGAGRDRPPGPALRDRGAARAARHSDRGQPGQSGRRLTRPALRPRLPVQLGADLLQRLAAGLRRVA